jgi:hypothetical protein
MVSRSSGHIAAGREHGTWYWGIGATVDSIGALSDELRISPLRIHGGTVIGVRF